MTFIEEYFTKVLDDVSCEKMKRISERILTDLICPGEFHFDEELANSHIDFIERFCKVPAGKVGAPLKLELFQKARLQTLFGFVDDNDVYEGILAAAKNGSI